VGAALAVAPLQYPAAAWAQPRLGLEIQRLAAASPEIMAFYAARQYRPLWVRGSALGREAEILLNLLQTAEADGRDPDRYLRMGVREAIEEARSGSPEKLALAEVVLSSAFATYVRDVRRPAEIGIIYGEPSLRSQIPRALTVLQRAAEAPSLDDYLRSMGWMHPLYAGLRRALATSPWQGGVMFPAEERLVRLNLERARILPAHRDRYILVDAAAARLSYYEGGKVKKSMRVVVGTPDQATPMMVGMIRYATLNPYWHVPPDLARQRIAPRVLSEGLSYFHDRGYEVVAEWSRSARVLDPATIDWKAVADGRKEILVRQRPGPRNGMGKVKFQFPNELGIYLHDTPAKQLFNEDQRGFSAGCVRLEDADGLGRMLFGNHPRAHSDEPEQTVALPKPVPVYITYLTAVADNGRIVERRDIYGRDGERLATAARPEGSAGSAP
jgi:murein L,D-transpeptidase YcbB/YkuD